MSKENVESAKRSVAAMNASEISDGTVVWSAAPVTFDDATDGSTSGYEA